MRDGQLEYLGKRLFVTYHTRLSVLLLELSRKLEGEGLCAPSVDAPLRARKNFRICWARSRMLPSVRPLMRQRVAAGLYGSSRTGSKSHAACLMHGGAPWFSRSRLADCCAILSLRSPCALAVPAAYAAAAGAL